MVVHPVNRYAIPEINKYILRHSNVLYFVLVRALELIRLMIQVQQLYFAPSPYNVEILRAVTLDSNKFSIA